jgi:hypothetical protein
LEQISLFENMDIVEENENKNNQTTTTTSPDTVPVSASVPGTGGNEILPTTNTVTTTSTTATTMTTGATTVPTNPVGENENETTVGQILELRDPLTRPVYRLSVKLIDTYKHINKVSSPHLSLPNLIFFSSAGLLRGQSKENS